MWRYDKLAMMLVSCPGCGAEAGKKCFKYDNNRPDRYSSQVKAREEMRTTHHVRRKALEQWRNANRQNLDLYHEKLKEFSKHRNKAQDLVRDIRKMERDKGNE